MGLKKWSDKTREELLIEQYKLRALINRLQDFKNNSNFESKYHRPASNQPAIERGCGLNLIKNNHRF